MKYNGTMPAMNAVEEISRPRRQLTGRERKVREWVLEHRGTLRQISDAASVSHQYVQKVDYGRAITPSRGLRIERMLKDAGCPGIRIG
jgi:hypothetical protein